MTDHKKPGVTFWATVLVVAGLMALVVYPLSIGPAFWAAGESETAFTVVAYAYFPVCWVISIGPDSVKEAFNSYLGMWTAGSVSIQ